MHMKRGIITLTALALWSSVGLNFASAQFGGTLGQAPPRSRPAVSPFINLGPGGAGAFYGIIKPQLDANRSINDLQQGVMRLNPDGSLKGQLDQATGTTTIGLQTGHSASFFNYGHYFPVNGPGSATNATGTSFGTGSGLGGSSSGLTTGSGFGVGPFTNRTFFGPNMAQPIIR